MMLKSLLTLIIAAMAIDLEAQPLSQISGLYNTGVDDNNQLLSPGSLDKHYTLITSADTSYPGPNVFVPTTFPGPSEWMANGANSDWISPSLTTGDSPYNAPGAYVYQTTFDLSQYDITTVIITGRWASDDDGDDIFINGISTGNAHLNGSVTAAMSWGTFTITNGFVPGTNTLDFLVSNWSTNGSGGTPTGLRVELSALGALAPSPCPGCPGLTLCYQLELQCINEQCTQPSIALALLIITLPV